MPGRRAWAARSGPGSSHAPSRRESWRIPPAQPSAATHDSLGATQATASAPAVDGTTVTSIVRPPAIDSSP